MMPDALEQTLAALVAEAIQLPATEVGRPWASPTPRPCCRCSRPTGVATLPLSIPHRASVRRPSFPSSFEDVDVDLEEDEDEPVALVERRGAIGREVLRPPSERPQPPAFDALAEAVSSAAPLCRAPPLRRAAAAPARRTGPSCCPRMTSSTSSLGRAVRPALTLSELLEED
ncbi:MAG: hypothetical protein R3F43_16030 [bacterium]